MTGLNDSKEIQQARHTGFLHICLKDLLITSKSPQIFQVSLFLGRIVYSTTSHCIFGTRCIFNHVTLYFWDVLYIQPRHIVLQIDIKQHFRAGCV